MTKLYFSYSNVLLPPRQLYSDSLTKANNYQSIRKIENLVLTVWPNGKPCTLINLYLQEKSYRSSGSESLETFASELTPLISFCFELCIRFEDLTDKSFTLFIEQLKSRKTRNTPNTKVISTNHRVKLVDSSIRFLKWLQENYCNGITLVGVESESPQITVIEKFNKHSGHYYFKHINSPDLSTPKNNKRAMPEHAILKLKDEAFKRSSLHFSAKFNRFGRQDYTNITMQYLYSRRCFTIWYLERTGGRPSELAHFKVPDREEYSSYHNLKLPVAKKRKWNWPTKNFSFTEYDITELNTYLDCRQEYVNHLLSSGYLEEPPNEMILTEQGRPMSARSLQKDFSRLVRAAGLRSENICMSLFRHRFITLHILLELRDELGEGTHSRHRLTDLWGEAARRKICDRVAEKTGHANGDSLKPYYDRVFAMTKVTDEKSLVERSNDVESAMHTLLRLLYTSIKKGIALDDRISIFINEIASQIEETRLVG